MGSNHPLVDIEATPYGPVLVLYWLIFYYKELEGKKIKLKIPSLNQERLMPCIKELDLQSMETTFSVWGCV